MDQSSNQVGKQADGGHVAAANGLLAGWALTNYGLSRNSRQQSNDYLVQLARRCQTEKPRIQQTCEEPHFFLYIHSLGVYKCYADF
jgi:hypothetical protein